jgi:hypothetical protein
MRLLAALYEKLNLTDPFLLDDADAEVHASESFLEALQMSHNDLAKLLRDALRTVHPTSPESRSYVWTRDVYDDKVVYELTGADDQSQLYQRSYAITDGSVTLGDPMKVIAVTQYVAAETAEIAVPAAVPVTQVSQPAAEAETELTGDLVPLVEKAVKADGTATIKIIAPGQGSSGYYPADVLKRDGPKVFAEGTHVYLDHPSASEESNRPERSVRDLAGSLTGPAVWNEHGAAGPGLYAPVKFIDSVAPHVNAIAAISGMSIRAAGKTGTREVAGKRVRTIESIDVAHSVDVVTKPGAGGKVLDLIESARSGKPVPPAERDEDVSKEQLEEAQKKIAELEEREKERDKELARLREREILSQAEQVVATALTETALPTLTRQRLITQLTANPPLTADGALDREALKGKVAEAAKAEADYLAAINGGNPVRGMGSTQPTTPEIPALEESDKRITAAIAGL